MLDYLDFDLEIGKGEEKRYPLAVLRSPAGEARQEMSFPPDDLNLDDHLNQLQNALLSPASQEEKTAQEFGSRLFDVLFSGEVRSRFDVSRERAITQDKGLRIRLRIQAPELAALPWEFLYDSRRGEYLCLSQYTPLVRYLELPDPPLPLSAQPPLKVLGMIANPADLPSLEVEREKERLERAMKPLQERSLAQLTWLNGQTWRDLQNALGEKTWHIFHFIGHGSFDADADEGMLAFADEAGMADMKRATLAARILADHRTLRLVILNSCEGATANRRDVFSSTAAVLVRRGLPAVLAMQYQITDPAAIELSRSFYEWIARGWSVDSALAQARKAISLALENSLEWGTPVLYLRAPDGKLFDVPEAKDLADEQPEPAEKAPAPEVKAPTAETTISQPVIEQLVAIMTAQAYNAPTNLGSRGYLRNKILQTEWLENWKNVRIGGLTGDADLDCRELIRYALKQGRISSQSQLTALGSLLKTLLPDLGSDDYALVEAILQDYKLV